MKRGTPEHPKVFDLMEQLGCDRPAALGYLELLWHFTAKYAPQGDIGRFTDARIEAGIDWGGRGKPKGKLIRALVDSKWIDADAEYRLKIHDWSEHADEATKKKLVRSGLSFVEAGAKVARQNPVTDGKSSPTVADNGGLPLPEPSHILSFPTSPTKVSTPLLVAFEKCRELHDPGDGNRALGIFTGMVGRNEITEADAPLMADGMKRWLRCAAWVDQDRQYLPKGPAKEYLGSLAAWIRERAWTGKPQPCAEDVAKSREEGYWEAPEALKRVI